MTHSASLTEPKAYARGARAGRAGRHAGNVATGAWGRVEHVAVAENRTREGDKDCEPHRRVRATRPATVAVLLCRKGRGAAGLGPGAS